MENRALTHGLTFDVQQKLKAKYNLEEEKEALEWMEKVLEKKFYTTPGMDSTYELLKNGVLLCELANALKPGSIKKIDTSKLPFKQMENISNFLTFAANYGISSFDSFQTVDLFEKQNMTQVILTITAVGRKAKTQGYTGPSLGPKEATKNVRSFDEETINQGKTYVSTQYGYTGGANQSGLNFGKTRKIID